MNLLFYLVSVLFALKVVLSLILPYSLLLEVVRTRTYNRSISLLPDILVDWALLLVGIALSFATTLPDITPLRVSCTGAVLIILSYVHFVAVGFVGGWIVSRFIRSQ